MIVRIKGTVTKILEKKTGVSQSGNSWATQEFVITEPNDKQTQICFEVFGEDNIAKLNLHIGANVEVSCVIDCHEWNGKYYTRLKALPPKEGENTSVGAPTSTPMPTPSATSFTNTPNNDALPF